MDNITDLILRLKLDISHVHNMLSGKSKFDADELLAIELFANTVDGFLRDSEVLIDASSPNPLDVLKDNVDVS